MRSRTWLNSGLLALLCVVTSLAADPARQPERAPATLAELKRLAKGRTEAAGARARLPLADPTGDIPSLEPPGSQRIPNYVRVFSIMPQGAAPFAHLFQTVLFGGTIPAETKLAAGVRVAQINRSPYVAAHLQRLLRATPRGRTHLAALQAGQSANLPAADQAAIRYADLLTRDIHGVTDAEFAKTRQSFHDPQIVELTMAVCFFNYLTRFSEALHLPVEPWVLDSTTQPLLPAVRQNPLRQARIGLVSDEEMKAVVQAEVAMRDPATRRTGLGLSIANSQRAMLQVPDFQAAWRTYGNTVRSNSQIGRDLQLQVSLAVSMANGCRYCTVHQIVGLRRQGIDPGKLIAMRKDDEALTPRERTAVTFARQLTARPDSITDADFAQLRQEFQEYGALEVVLQTCAFSFMNRFTDNLRLPSEEEAIEVYREIFGDGR
jgi:alkylhydroperoxidase family enzyme